MADLDEQVEKGGRLLLPIQATPPQGRQPLRLKKKAQSATQHQRRQTAPFPVGVDHGDQGKVKKDDDKNKKTTAKAPAKRGNPTAVENAPWGEVKNSEQ